MIDKTYYVYLKDFGKKVPYKTKIYNLNDLMFDQGIDFRDYFDNCLKNISTYERKHSKNHYSMVIVRNIIYTFLELIFNDLIDKASIFKFPGKYKMLLSVSNRSFFNKKIDLRNPENYGPLFTLDKRILRKAKNEYYLSFSKKMMRRIYSKKQIGVKYSTLKDLENL